MPLADQRDHWQATYLRHPVMYGVSPSEACLLAAAKMTDGSVLELGAGHGRDALHFASLGLSVHALDYASSGLQQANQAARDLGLADRLTVTSHDVREPLPSADGRYEYVFAHMLLCMALSTHEIKSLVSEVRRVLRSGGVFIYTARNISDAHYMQGRSLGDDIYEHGGFAVHFFDEHLVTALLDGWDLMDRADLKEGELPRRLWWIAQRKSSESTRK